MKHASVIASILLLVIVANSVWAAGASSGSYSYLRTTFLNQDPDPAEPGKYVELRWKVEKLGNAELKNVTFILEPSYPFSFDPSDQPERLLGSWKGYSGKDDYYTLYYKLLVDERALEGDYKLRLKSRDSSDNDAWVVTEYSIRVAKKQEPDFVLGNLITSPVKLVSDTDGAKLELEVQNIGTSAAENVNVELQLPPGFKPTYSYSTKANLGTIAEGGSKKATFYVDIDEGVAGGQHEGTFIIQYKNANDDEGYHSSVLSLMIPVKNKPVFEIEGVQSSPAVIRPGSTVELRVTVKNIGGETADSVSIRAYKETSQPFEFDEKTDFIGKLKPGQSGEAVLKFTVDKAATEKSYLLETELRGVYGDEVLIQDKAIPVLVTTAAGGGGGITGNVIGAGSGSSAMGIGIVIAIVVVGLLGYVIGSRRAKR